MYIVVVGCGRLGSQLASIASKDGHDVAVVSRNPAEFKRLGPDFSGMTVEGVEFDIDTLREAGIEKADAFAAVTGDDNTNIMAAQVAKNVFNVPIITARVFDPEKYKTFLALGIDAICPTTLGASSIYSKFLLKNKRTHFLFYNDKLELIEIVYRGEQKTSVKKLESLGDFKVVSVTEKNITHIAKEDTIINPGSSLLIAVLVENYNSIKKIFNL
ncbi:MAG: potassium channel family protein [Caldisericum sp.]